MICKPATWNIKNRKQGWLVEREGPGHSSKWPKTPKVITNMLTQWVLQYTYSSTMHLFILYRPGYKTYHFVGFFLNLSITTFKKLKWKFQMHISLLLPILIQWNLVCLWKTMFFISMPSFIEVPLKKWKYAFECSLKFKILLRCFQNTDPGCSRIKSPMAVKVSNLPTHTVFVSAKCSILPAKQSKYNFAFSKWTWLARQYIIQLYRMLGKTTSENKTHATVRDSGLTRSAKHF